MAAGLVVQDTVTGPMAATLGQGASVVAPSGDVSMTSAGVFSVPGVSTSNSITDPGNGGAIPVTRSGSCALTSGGAETRTLAIPTFKGQRLALYDDTHGGNIVVTSAQALNQTGNTVMTFGAVRDNCVLEAITVGGALRWQIVHNDGVALS